MIFKVRTKFIFKGYFLIEAENALQAKNLVKEQCGLCMGGKIHTTLPDDKCDWNFDPHSTTVVTTIKKAKAGRVIA